MPLSFTAFRDFAAAYADEVGKNTHYSNVMYEWVTYLSLCQELVATD
jgi:hypothetical protein